MKKLLFLLFLIPGLAKANGPLYKQKDVVTQMEFDNVYQDIRAGARADILTTNTSGYVFTGQGNGINPIWQARIFRDLFLGSAQTANATTTSGSYIAPTNATSLTFTPTHTSTYSVSGVFAISNNTAGARIWIVIKLTSGSGSTTKIEQEAVVDVPANSANFVETVSVYSIYVLTAGTSYTFQNEIKVNAGTMTVLNNVTSGSFLIAQEIAN